MTVLDLITRLLKKRCASCIGRNDNYLLINGNTGQGNFSKVGTDEEEPPLLMENALTLDEIKLSGFLLISSKVSKVRNRTTINILMIGVPFPILHRDNLFDYEDIYVTKHKNVRSNGYGKQNPDISDTELFKKFQQRSIWDRFYCETSNEYKSVNFKATLAWSRFKEKYGRYYKIGPQKYVDLVKLAKRFSIITIGILREAAHRAELDDKMAYIVMDKNSE